MSNLDDDLNVDDKKQFRNNTNRKNYDEDNFRGFDAPQQSDFDDNAQHGWRGRGRDRNRGRGKGKDRGRGKGRGRKDFSRDRNDYDDDDYDWTIDRDDYSWERNENYWDDESGNSWERDGNENNWNGGRCENLWNDFDDNVSYACEVDTSNGDDENSGSGPAGMNSTTGGK